VKLPVSVIILFVIISSTFTYAGRFAPELPSGLTKKPLVVGKHSMVVTNNPLASAVAQKILAAGGNAVDATVAAAFVLGLTEPQSSGIGGGGYALIYNKQQQKLLSYDGRETAPHTANDDWFLNKDRSLPSMNQIILSAKSIGVPGHVALLAKIHHDHGKLPWAELLAPAIELATKGFKMSPRLNTLLTADAALFVTNTQVKAIFFEGNHIKTVGSLIKNSAYAQTVKIIAKNPDEFYKGKLSVEIIEAINHAADQPLFDKEDFTQYQINISAPICSYYRKKYKICSVSPSSAGGVTLQELMGIYALKYSGTNPNDPMWFYQFIEASKLAYADRNQYLADPAFVKLPISGLLANDYLMKRSKLITNKALTIPVKAGVPVGVDPQYAADISPKLSGTTSIAIVDKNGNAVALTATIESQFGSHIFTNGFFLNNELTDFSLTAKDAQGKFIANRIQPGKRSRSSIASTMVFNKNGGLLALTGSPGGSDIICFVAKNLILMLDMHLSPDLASDAINLCSPNRDPVIESSANPIPQIAYLQNMGEIIIRKPLVSGVTNILRNPDGSWSGAADPRREGVALGA
jgi:gamma-glutamyltranspeptidase/glutathione hydrolase